MKSKMMIFLLIIILSSISVFPANTQTKSENIRSDIHIMETILDKLLQASRNHLFNGRNIKGFYFDDYGLLFTVNLENQFAFSYAVPGKNINILNKAKKIDEAEEGVVKDSKGNLVVVAPDRHTFSIGIAMDDEKFDEWIKKLDKKMQTFMGSYVDVGNYLSGNDKVSVVVFFGSDEPKAKIYQVTKKAIGDFRNEKVTDKAFDQKITKQLVKGDDHVEEIDIMGAIMKTALEGKKKSRVLWGDRIHGVFLKDLGVMFSFGDRFFSNSYADMFHLYLEESENYKAFDLSRAEALIEKEEKKQSEQKKQFREKLSEFQNDIIKVIGQYGSSSFRFLPNDQSIFVLFGTERYSGGDVSNVMIRLKKADFVSYSQDRINLENLKKRAHIVEY
jgi:hypothetical protein